MTRFSVLDLVPVVEGAVGGHSPGSGDFGSRRVAALAMLAEPDDA